MKISDGQREALSKAGIDLLYADKRLQSVEGAEELVDWLRGPKTVKHRFMNKGENLFVDCSGDKKRMRDVSHLIGRASVLSATSTRLIKAPRLERTLVEGGTDTYNYYYNYDLIIVPDLAGSAVERPHRLDEFMEERLHNGRSVCLVGLDLSAYEDSQYEFVHRLLDDCKEIKL